MTKQEAPAPDPMVGKRRIMDFSPAKKPVASASRRVEVSVKTSARPRVSRPDVARSAQEPATKVPARPSATRPTQRRRLMMNDVMRPVKRKAPRPANSRPVKQIAEELPIEEPAIEEVAEVAEDPVEEVVEQEPITVDVVEEQADDEIEIPVEPEVEMPVENLVEKPRRRGISIDFMKKVSSAISSVRRGGQVPAEEPIEESSEAEPVDVAMDSAEDVAEDTTTEETVEESKTEEVKVSRVVEEVTTDDGSFTVADALDVMAADEKPAAESAASEDDELASVLAGFADAATDTPDLADNLSPEAQDFTEEIDALEESEAVPDELLEEQPDAATEDFISEPKPLFGASVADPLVEQSIHRKKPEFKEPTKYIDGSSVRSAGEKVAKKPPVEPYRQILGGKSPFLNSVPVEKRPLSGYAPAQGAKSAKPAVSEKVEKEKVSYREKILKTIHEKPAAKPAPQTMPKLAPIREPGSLRKQPEVPARRIQKETVVVPEMEGEASRFPLAIAVALTLILGAIAGAFVYLVFLQ